MTLVSSGRSIVRLSRHRYSYSLPHRCLDAIAAHALDQNDARAAPRGFTAAAGPLPGHNTNNTKTLGPAITTRDDKPAARLPGGRRRLDGHGQDG